MVTRYIFMIVPSFAQFYDGIALGLLQNNVQSFFLQKIYQRAKTIGIVLKNKSLLSLLLSIVFQGQKSFKK